MPPRYARLVLGALAVLAAPLAGAPLAHAQDGRLDPFFSGDGVAFGTLGQSEAYDVLSDDLNGPVVVGTWRPTAATSDAFIARYHPDGTLDARFSGDGVATLDLGGRDEAFQSVALTADGRYAAAGFSDRRIVVARFLASGAPDPAFGTAGVARFSAGATGTAAEGAYSVAAGPAGTLYVAGATTTPVGTRAQFLVRLTPAGALDASFGDGGFARIGVAASEAYSVAVLPDGRIVLAGQIDRGTSVDMLATRVLPTGNLDPSFNGVGVLPVDIEGGSDRAFTVVLRPDGGLFLVGSSDDLNGAPGLAGTFRQYTVVSLTASGTRAPGFGTNGVASFDLSPGDDEAYDGALDSDGRLIVGGTLGRRPAVWGIVRLRPSGALDPVFGINGVVRSIFGDSSALYALAVNKKDEILGAGLTDTGDLRTWTIAQYTTVRQAVAGESGPDAAIAFEGARPNPLQSSTTLRYRLIETADATLTVHDVLGREVTRLAEGVQAAGPHEVRWDASALPAGVYVARLQSGTGVQTVRLTVVR